jgi:Flp pilus assembly pilin Flp
LVGGTPKTVPDRGRDDEGQAFVEYALVLGLVALVAITALTEIGENLLAFFEFLAEEMSTMVPGG